MRALELETWVIEVLDRAAAGQPNEDFRIEFKSAWPDPVKAARRLAGHANAARGDRILWIIGVDDATGAVVGAKHEEMTKWWPVVESRFDEMAPALVRDMNVPHGGQTVTALLWETDRAPFVVKATQAGQVAREVPWRIGTRVEAARRQDLLRLLTPLTHLPDVEVIDGSIQNVRTKDRDAWWMLEIDLYITPRGRAVHFPLHKYGPRRLSSARTVFLNSTSSAISTTSPERTNRAER